MFKKGHEKLGGRPKGRGNKVQGDVRAMVLKALSESGGVEYLKRQAEENPVAFLSLVGRCLPKEVKLDVHHVTLEELIARVDSDAKQVIEHVPESKVIEHVP